MRDEQTSGKSPHVVFTTLENTKSAVLDPLAIKNTKSLQTELLRFMNQQRLRFMNQQRM